jgi:predicted aldo/keto reductase-like oxidoreductase
MQYRSFPKLPATPVSALGFGCMRLPTRDADPAHIDEELATRLVRRAIDAGVNYLDTAYPYHAGESERFLGRALRDGYRERVQLATKLPVWHVTSPRDWERLLDEQLRRLATDRIDFYLLHALGAERWEQVRALGGLPALERARRDGRIGHLGFSFHGSLDAFKTIVDGYDWEHCLIQYNFLDEEYQAGRAGLRYATARGVGVAVMEPLRGGALAAVPPAVARLLAASGREWSAAEWALRWIWHHPEVVTVLSGMNSLAQLDENLAVAGAALPGSLTPDDLAVVAQVRDFFQARMRVPCTTCGYCQPCPHGVAIPDVLALYNAAAMFESRESPARVYDLLFVRDGAGAEACEECGECEPKCPQEIEIIARLKEAHAHLTGR